MQTTPNYGFTIYEANDVTAYMTATGWNGTMSKIDTDMKVIENKADQNTTDLTVLEQQVSTDHDEINELTVEVSDLTTTVNGNTSNIAGLNTRVITAEAAVAALSTKVDNNVGSTFRGVLSHGETTIAIPINVFDNNTLVIPFTSVFGLVPATLELRAATSGQPNLCVMTFEEAQSEDVNVAVMLYYTPQATS